jgi:drug/metabolite transporter (DMT)-like permease
VLSLLYYLKLTVTAILWGGAYVAGRSVAVNMDPFSASFLRFGTASIFLLIFILKSHGKLPLLPGKQIFPVIVLGLTGIFGFSWFFFAGLKTTAAGRASLIIATVPAFLALFSYLFFREPLTIYKVLGIMLSMAGAITVISHGNPSAILQGKIGRGEILLVGCAANWVVYSLVGRTVMTKISPLIALTYACMIGSVCLFFPAAAEGLLKQMPHYPVSVWPGIVYLGLFATSLGFLWYNEGVRHIGPAKAGVFINLVPISAIALSALILHESIDLSLATGAAMVLTGVYLTNK